MKYLPYATVEDVTFHQAKVKVFLGQFEDKYSANDN